MSYYSDDYSFYPSSKFVYHVEGRELNSTSQVWRLLLVTPSIVVASDTAEAARSRGRTARVLRKLVAETRDAR